MSRSQAQRWSSMLLLAFLTIAGALAVVLFLSGLPVEGPPPQGGGGLGPQPAALALSSQSSNNLKIGDLFRLAVHARPQVGVLMLVSSNSGPSIIGPYRVDLSPDWFVLQGWQWTSGGDQVGLQIPVPDDRTLLGRELVLQSVVFDPMTLELAWTNSALHRVTESPPSGRNVLLVSQTTMTAEAPHAPAQAEQLAQTLRGFGHHVTVVENGLPADVAGFDCLLDCRFTLPPREEEKTLMLHFLQRYGGVFLLCGPYLGSSWGQYRLAWIQDFVTAKLDVPVVIASGANLSGGGAGEVVSPLADPRYLHVPSSVAGLPYHVEQEGGNFGPPGYSTTGVPWIVASGGPGTVFGMLFKPEDIHVLPIKGSLAVLFNGASDALTQTAANPHAHLIFTNLVFWLDA